MSEQKKRLIIFAIILVVVLALSFYFDNTIIKFFLLIRNIYLDKFFLGITIIDNEIILAVLLTLLLLWKKREKWILPLWVTMLVTALVSLILKIVVRRPRPFIAGVVPLMQGITDNINYHIWDFSFPSFDSAFVFCAIPIVWKFFPRFRYVWAAFAILVALSRVYIGVHYLSDIISGALIGYLIGILIIKLENKKKIFSVVYNKLVK